MKDFNGNVEKVKKSFAENPEAKSTTKALLQQEKASGIHGAGGKLKDPSGAMGLTWAKRHLEYINNLFQGLAASPEAETVASAKAAHAGVLKPYHGWMASGAFSASLLAMPYRKDLFKSFVDPTLAADAAATDKVVVGDLHVFSQHLDALTKTITAELKELDLDDVRKV